MKLLYHFLLYILCCFAGFQAYGINPRVISDTSGLRVMTYNIHHANPPSKEAEGTIDLQAIARVINEGKPDLVALQEIDVNTTRSGVDVNEAAVLARLTGMHFHFSQALAYQGGKYGDAVLSRFPIIDTFSYRLPVVAGTNEEIRVLSMVKVKLPDNKTILFGSTHLGLSEDTRLLQAEALVKIVKQLSLPLIVGGDFNALPDSKPIGILDQVFTRSCTSDCGFTSSAQNPRHKIDYIMYRPKDQFKVLSYQVIRETYASDHFPLLVTFGYK